MTDPEPYPVAYLKVEEAGLEEKDGWSMPSVAELRRLLRLDDKEDGLDEKSRELMEDLGPVQRQEHLELADELRTLDLGQTTVDSSVTIFRLGRWFAASVDGQTEGEEDVGDELRRSFERLSGKTRPLRAVARAHR